MTSSSTLTSLAMLKVHIDQGQDYLDYLRPFILQVLIAHGIERITDIAVKDHILIDWGLEIPTRAIQVVLKRLARKYPLKKDGGVYIVTGVLPDPRIVAKKADANRHINAVIADLREFSKNTIKPITNDKEAVDAICAFLSRFDIPCLRAYLRGTTIPDIDNNQDAQIILVCKYVLMLQATNPERFDSFMVVVKGHMLANALLCPDLQSAPKTYKGMAFYLDTPLLVQRLGLEGSHKQLAVENLIELLSSLGATIAVFSHSKEELENVIIGAAKHIESPDGRGTIVAEARKHGTTKSDLLVLVNQLDDKLEDFQIKTIATPKVIANFQIDETAFEKILINHEVYYSNPRAKEHDINSVRSIYVLRAHTAPKILEHSKAVLVTSNTGFSKTAFQYGQIHKESREISSVITDFSLANIAWLKAPLGSPNIPMAEVLAFAYAAMQPSNELLDKYMVEIDKLEKNGKLTARDHQLLRSSQFVQDELMGLTLGDEDALTEQTVTETLKRVTAEIIKEEDRKLKAEHDEHNHTKSLLDEERKKRENIQKKLYWSCLKKAKNCTWIITFMFSVFLVVGLICSLGVSSNYPYVEYSLFSGLSIFIMVTLINLIFGITVKNIHQKIQNYFHTCFLKHESAVTGIPFEDIK